MFRPSQQALLRSELHPNWVQRTKEGGRVTLYADVVFSFAFHQVLKALALDLDTEDLRPKVPTASCFEGVLQQGEDVRLPNPAFFDDFVPLAIAGSPEELVPKCQRVLENTGTVFTSHGMHANDSAGNGWSHKILRDRCRHCKGRFKCRIPNHNSGQPDFWAS